MRPISQTALARRYEPAQRVAWLLTLAAGDWTWRGATLAVTLGTDPYPARLDATLQWREALPDSDRPGGLARASTEVRILDLPGPEDSLRGRLAVTPPVGIAATLRLAWLDAAAPLDPSCAMPLAADDAAILLEGRVTAWRIEPLGVTLTLADEIQALAARRIGRLLHAAMLSGSSSSLGLPLPWIFGRLEDAELLPLASGATGALAAPLDAQAGTIPLGSLDGFPTHGRMQLGEELIDYSDIDLARKTLGTERIPVWRGAPAEHPRGTPVRAVPPGGFTWLVADHPCRAVESVRADSIPLAPETWSTTRASLDGQDAQIITLAQWPLGTDGRESRRLTATVEGLADGDGTLLENPARILRRLLTDPRLGGLSSDRLDTAAFDQAAGELDARGYRYARRFSGGETLGGLLESAAQEAGLWLVPAPPIRLALAEPTPQPAAAEEELGDSRWLDPLAPARIAAPRGLIPPDAVELVGAPRSQGRGRPACRFPSESEAPGALPRRFAMQWLDVARNGAGDAGELLWAHLGEVPLTVEQECPLGAALLTAGATIRLTSPALDLDRVPAWVAAVEIDSPTRVRLRLRGPWAGPFCWQADALNFIRRYAFGAHLAITLGGAVVARLSRSGALRLRGRLREGAALTPGPLADSVTLSGGRLYFAYPSGGGFVPFLALDAAGNADLAGALRERSALAMNPAGQALGNAPGRFWLSPDATTGIMEFEAATEILHLKGILIESIRL